MSIEIPEDVVCSANAGYDSVISRGGTTIEAMRSALRAALEGWLVPGPYRFLKNGDNPSDWFDREINGEPPNPKHLRKVFRIQNAYTLRKDKTP